MFILFRAVDTSSRDSETSSSTKVLRTEYGVADRILTKQAKYLQKCILLPASESGSPSIELFGEPCVQVYVPAS